MSHQPGHPPPQPPPGYPPGPPVYPPRPTGPREPGNGEAVTSMVLGIISLGLLLFTAGFSSVISLACAVVAIPFGRKGKRRVDEGETRKGRAFAQAGYITGIVGVALSILATIGWVLFFVVIGNTAGSFDSNFYDDFDFEPQSAPLVAVRLTASLARALTG